MKTKILIYLQAFNAGDTISQTIDSILHQSYSDFVLFICDNASTDDTSRIIHNYAERDKRIIVYTSERNSTFILFSHIIPAIDTHYFIDYEFFTNIDADDWWDLNYLERLVSVADSTDADIVCTGKQLHEEWTGRTPFVRIPQQITFSREYFSEYFPVYRTVFASVWGKLVHRNVFQAMDLSYLSKFRFINGLDYLINIEWLRHAKRICLDDSVLYHYRLRKHSFFHTYDPARIESNRIVYENWREFLSSFGPISRENEHHLACLSATLCQLTLNVISMSEMDPMQKFEEYRRLLSEGQNRDLSRWKHPYIRKRLKKALNDLLQSGEELQAGAEAGELFGEVMELFAPRCGRAVPVALCPLLRQDEAMADALLYDDANRLMERSVALIAEHQEAEQLIPVILHLTEPHPTLHGIADLEFIRTYPDIYLALWREDYAQAEEAMDALLEEHSIRNQTFLELYLSLEAVNKNFANYIKAEQYREHLRLDDNESFTS